MLGLKYDLTLNLIFICLYDLILYVPSTIFQLTRAKARINAFAQGPQRCDASEARPRGPSVSSQATYH